MVSKAPPGLRTSSRKGMKREELQFLPLRDQNAPLVITDEWRLKRIKASDKSMRQKILAVIQMRREYGATDKELQQLLEVPPNTEVPLRNGLMHKGLVVWSGKYRKTHSSCHIAIARVWVVANGKV